MRLKDLFAVPKGQRITDKYLCRVLVSYICSILLCMGCLAGTTWAWFTVSIENTENVIQIGTPQVNVTVDGSVIASVTELSFGSAAAPGGTEMLGGATVTGGDVATDGTEALGSDVTLDGAAEWGSVTVNITHANEADSLSKKSKLYVTLIKSGENVGQGGKEYTILGYTVLDDNNNYQATITIESSEDFGLSWEVSWFQPANAELITNDKIIIKEMLEVPTVSGNEITLDGEGTSGATVSGGDNGTQ